MNYHDLDNYIDGVLPGDRWDADHFSCDESDYVMSKLESAGYIVDLRNRFALIEVCDTCDGEGYDGGTYCSCCDGGGWVKYLGANGGAVPL